MYKYLMQVVHNNCVWLSGVTMCCIFAEWKTRMRRERCVN